MRRYVPSLGLLLLCGAQAFAQQQPPAPNQVLVMTREQFKPGNMPAHNKQIPAFYALFEKAKVGAPRLGLVPVFGDQNHLLYLEAYPSFAEMEGTTKKEADVLAGSPALQAEFDALTQKNAQLHDSQTAWVAVRRSDLTYRPVADRVAKARYVFVTTTRVNTARGGDYADYVKQTNAAREKANLDEHSTVYQVISGALAGTFLTFTTNRSLAEFDDVGRGAAARTQKLNEALGGDAVVKARQKTLAEIIATSASALYSVDRTISRPSPEFVTMDPDFWKPKEMPKKEPAKK